MLPLITIRAKNHTEEWFDGEVFEAISVRDKSFKKYKNSKLHVDKGIYNAARNKVQKLVMKKKKMFYEEKLKENIGRPKKLWKTINSLGLVSKKSGTKICLKEKENLSFDPKINAGIFKDFFSNLAGDLVNNLPNPTNKFGMNSVKSYYEKLRSSGKQFSFTSVTENNVLDILKKTNPMKAAGIDQLGGKFLKDGASIIASPIAQLCNLSISLSAFPDKCKVAKLKPLYKKGSPTEPKNYRPISLLPLISKLIEKVIHDQTQTFLVDNNILYNYQSGFRGNHSTDSCLSYLNDKILQGFDSGHDYWHDSH